MDFRGASAHALDALSDSLAGHGADHTDLAALADELFALSELIGDEPSLRRVLTDVSIIPEKRQQLARDLFDGKVSQVASDLVAEAVGRRWTRMRDLGDGLERLSEIALARSTGDQADRLVDELFSVGEAVQHDAGLREALADPVRSIDDRRKLIDDLLGQKTLPATVSLVKQALRGTYRTVPAALAAQQEVAAGVRDERVATVRVAHPLSDDDQRRLEAALARRYGREVHLNVLVDPAVLGGLRVEIGDDVIDGTVANRLDDVRRRLAG